MVPRAELTVNTDHRKIDGYYILQTLLKRIIVIEFVYPKEKGQIFSLSFDVGNLNVHLNEETHYNLGLIRIHGSSTVEHCIELLSERLKKFGLNFETDYHWHKY